MAPIYQLPLVFASVSCPDFIDQFNFSFRNFFSLGHFQECHFMVFPIADALFPAPVRFVVEAAFIDEVQHFARDGPLRIDR